MNILWTVKRRFARKPAARDLSETLVLEALRKLDAHCPTFDHLNFDHLSLHRALQDFLGLEIRVELLRDDLCALLRRSVRRSTIQAELVYAPGSGLLTMIFPASLHPSDRKDAYYHELAHLMAAHPMPYPQQDRQADIWDFWIPPRVLCERTPPFDLRKCGSDAKLRTELLAWCENDADRWAEHLRTISALGRDVYLREEQILGL